LGKVAISPPNLPHLLTVGSVAKQEIEEFKERVGGNEEDRGGRTKADCSLTGRSDRTVCLVIDFCQSGAKKREEGKAQGEGGGRRTSPFSAVIAGLLKCRVTFFNKLNEL